MIADGTSSRRILVVEDDPITLGAIQMVLKWEGFQVDGASNGQQALDQLRGAQAKPDLILLDVRMPVLDGKQFRQQQKHDPALKDIPVVIISGADSPWPDAVGHLQKPFQPEELLAAIRGQAEAKRPGPAKG